MTDNDPAALAVMGAFYLAVAVVALLCTVALMEFTSMGYSMEYAAAMMLASSGVFGIGFLLSIGAAVITWAFGRNEENA